MNILEYVFGGAQAIIVVGDYIYLVLVDSIPKWLYQVIAPLAMH